MRSVRSIVLSVAGERVDSWAIMSLTTAAAQGNSPLVMLIVLAVTALICVSLGVALLKVMRTSDRRAEVAVDRTLELALRDLAAEEARLGSGFDAGEPVRIEFVTYSGFLLWTTERRHQYTLPKEFALILLRRLHWHNVRRGLLAHGGLLIPFVSWLTLVQQRRSIAKQLRSGARQRD